MESNRPRPSTELTPSKRKEAVQTVEKRFGKIPTLNSLDGTSSRFIGADMMILLFTSDYCTWCGVLKSMLENECRALGTEQQVYEVDVEKQHRIAEAYGVLAVPTMVAGSMKISGVPTTDDLHSFLLQAVSRGILRPGRKMVQSVLREVRQIRSSEGCRDQVMRTIS